MQRDGLKCKCQAWGVSRAPGVGGRFFLRSALIASVVVGGLGSVVRGSFGRG